MSLSSGTKLGPYEVLALIGKGGMGEVYRAHDSRLNRNVAIKVSNAQFTERFTREARAIAALNHTNICHLYDVGPDYLVMEYVDGQDLHGPLDFEGALPIIQQLIDGIEAAHEKNIVHRDLKPANIKITVEGVVKILDFGLAKALESPPSNDGNPENSPTFTIGATQAGALLGTAAYMSPEQAKGKAADRRSDIWSFGVVVYELLAGRRPFEGETVAEALGSVLNKEPDWTPIPERARRLLQRCLQKDRKHRLGAVSDSRWMLEEAPARVSTSPARPFWLWPAVAALGVIASAVFALLYFREQPPQERSLRFQIPLPNGMPEADQQISPDGRYLVFANRDSSDRLWLRPLNSLAAQPLAGTEGAYFPFWSPDSKSIGFFLVDGKVKRIEVTGGPAVTLADAPISFGASWGVDGNGGVILFTPTEGSAILRVPAGGGTVTPATKIRTGEVSHRFPWFLPDGRHFLYAAMHDANAVHNTIHVGDLSSSEDSVIGESDSEAVYSQGFLLFSRQLTLMAQPFDANRRVTTGNAVPLEQQIHHAGGAAYQGVYADFSASATGLLAFRSAFQGYLQLTWVDRSGNQLGPLGKAGNIRDFQFSPDYKSIAVTVEMPTSTQSANTDIWIYEANRGLRTRFTFDTAIDSDPVWSPDGRSIVFASNRKQPQHLDLYRKSSDGAGAEELLYSDNLNKKPKSWSADGKFLLYEAGGTEIAAWVLPLTTERSGAALKPFPFAHSGFSVADARLSPDGRWIAYTSNESQQNEVYAARFPGAGGKRLISVAGGSAPRWRRDGKEIFYVAPDGKVMSAAVTVKGDALEAGEVRPLFRPVASISLDSYDVSADGQRFLIVPPDPASTEGVTVVQNWTAGLKKQARE